MNRPTNPKYRVSRPQTDPVERLLDTHLAGKYDELAPSSGFAASVMESIHVETGAPPPIAFPWRRVVPGAVAVLCGLAVLLVVAMRALHAGAVAGPAIQGHTQLALSPKPAFTPGEWAICCALLAACLSIATVAASFRFIGRSR